MLLKKNTASSFNNKNLKPGDIVYFRILCEDEKTIAESGIAILRKCYLYNNSYPTYSIWPYEGINVFTNKVGLFDFDECIFLASTVE